MQQKTRRILGWSFSALPLLFLLVGAFPKFTTKGQADFATMAPTFWPAWIFGLVLIAAVVLYLIPKTQVIGFVLASSYYGGAAAIAWQVMGGFMNAVPIFGALVLLWIGQAMLRPSLLQRADE